MKSAVVLALGATAAAHYGAPPCEKDEIAGNIQGFNGTLCAPPCDDQGKCPTDVPAGTWKATPQCVLNGGPGGKRYCALGCKLVGCPTGSHCAMVGIVAGVCVWPNNTRVDTLPAKDLVYAAPQRPHLSQAWTAQSVGDGQPGKVGTEHYIYEDFKSTTDPYALQGHIFDYGSSCKKIELKTRGDVGTKSSFLSGTFYINCDSVDCCYGRGNGKANGIHLPTKDIKKWDIDGPGLFRSVKFAGIEDTTELGNKTVKAAEHWEEILKLPFAKNLTVTYNYYITRNGNDIISHRIDYAAAGQTAGSILYGDFQPQHNVTAFRDTFKVPEVCYPQGSHRGHAMACSSKKIEEWEKTYFSRGIPAATESQPAIVV